MAGGLPATLAKRDTGFASAIAVDDRNVYWTDRDSNLVLRVSLDGGAITTLAVRPDAGPSSIALDDASVYWSESFASKIMKLTPK